MVGEELKRHHFENRQQKFRGRRDKEHRVCTCSGFPIVFRGHGNHFSTAAFDVFKNVQSFLVAQKRIGISCVASGECDDCQSVANKGVGTMTQLSGRQPLCLNVGDFLELECTFTSDGIMHPPP